MSEDIRSRPAATDSPPAARLGRPRWRDARLLGGLLLVLLSVVLGARVLAAADDTVAVWSVTTDLAAGERPPGGRPHAGSGAVGRHVQRLPRRLGSVAGGLDPHAYGHRGRAAPARRGGGARVRTAAAQRDRPCRAFPRARRPRSWPAGGRLRHPEDGTTRLVQTGALVADVVADGGRLGPSGASSGVVLSVTPDQVAALVQAAQDGAIDLVRRPPGS